MATSLGIWKKK